MHKNRIRVLTALFLIASLLWSAMPLQAGPAKLDPWGPQQRSAVSNALAWLRTQQRDDGSFDSSSGGVFETTCTVVLAVAGAGQDPATWRTSAPGAASLVDYLAAVASAQTGQARETGMLITAVVAAGRDPSSFGGLDLVTSLRALYSDGAYGTSAPDQAWAILALAAARQAMPAAARDHLKAIQQPDGGWLSEPGWFFGADTQTTAVALQALVAAGEPITSTAVTQALAFYTGQQKDDGGFSFIISGGEFNTTRAGCTAMTIQALLAAGQNPLAEAWTKGEGNPLTRLLAFQLPSGGFEWQEWQGGRRADVLETARAILGIMGQPLPYSGRAVSLKHALAWLHTQQAADGSFPQGQYSPSYTAQAVAAIAAAGEAPTSWKSSAGKSPLDYLTTQVKGVQYPGLYGRYIMAAGTSFLSPYNFGGVNLVAAVQSFYNRSTGSYSSGGYTADHAVVMLGLASVGENIPAGAITWLRNAQNTDGGWGWAVGQDSDSNSTAWVVQALLATGEPRDAEPLRKAVAYLHRLQNGDGGFANQKPAPPWGTEDSDGNSTPATIQGLLALGEDVTGWDWTTSLTATNAITMALHNPIQRLHRYQTAEGGFEYVTPGESNLMATLQALPAVAGSTWPLVSPGVRSARQALAWLRTQQQDDGGFSGFGHNAGFACDAVLAIVTAGQDPADWRTPTSGSAGLMEYLTRAAPGFATSAQTTGKLIMAVVAAAQDPYRFGRLNLVSKLGSLAHDGAYGSSATDQAWAMLGLAAANLPVPQTAVAKLLSFQQESGAWEGGPGWGPDTNTTALALQALSVAGEPSVSGAVRKAIAYLATQQNDDGGFPYTKPSVYGTESDANSTAVTVQGLVAAGEDPLGAAWTRSGGNPLAGLLRLQVASGAFEWKPGTGESLLATAQAIPALLSQKLPLRILPPYTLYLPAVSRAAAR